MARVCGLRNQDTAQRSSDSRDLWRQARQKRNGTTMTVVPFTFEAGAWVLEAELAVRGLAAALTAVALFVLEHEVDGRRGNGFANVTAADAGAKRTVPVTLDN